MRRRRMAIVLVVFGLAWPGLGLAVPAAFAAPMAGVTFVAPVRAFDAPVPAGTTIISLPNSPPGLSQVLVNVTVATDSAIQTGVLMGASCGLTANSATDVILPIEASAGLAVVSNEVFLPSNGTICLTATVPVTRVVVDEKGWVGSSGASYVDLPFSYVATVAGPIVNAAINVSGFGVPANAAGVAVWLDATSSTSGFAVLHPCDQPSPVSADAQWGAGEPARALVAGTPTSSAGLCIDVRGAASVDISIDGFYAVGATPTSTSPPQVRYRQERAPGFVGTSPTRLLDTRTAEVPLIGGQVYRLDLSPYVPPDTTAVVMNVTVTESTSNGFITVYPCDGDRPVVSNLNYVARQTVPNLVTVDAGSTSEVCFYASTTTHLLADLAGYYLFGGGDGFAPSPPVRMFDTRTTTKLAAGSVFEFDLSPFVAPDASSVVFNLTATEVQGPGYVTAYPCGQAPPLASNLNVSAGQTVPNLVTVALPKNRHVCLFTLSATHLLADLAGWYAPSAPSGFVSIQPIRWVDTRDGTNGPPPAGDISAIPFGADFPGATAMVFNATVTEPALAGYLTAFPCGAVPPVASNVNFVAGQTVPNMVISALDSEGGVCVFNSASLHWIVDVSGFFTDAPLLLPYFPDGTDSL